MVDISKFRPADLEKSRREASKQALDAIEQGRRPSVERRARNVPKSRRVAYLRAASGEAPPRAAIKAFCRECVGFVDEEVQLCTATACPLFMYRPKK